MRRRKGGLSFRREKKKINIGVVKEIFIWLFEIAITVGVAFIFVYFIGLRTSAVGQSMAGTINAGDEILINRFIYLITDPKPNDLIVFFPNGNEKSHMYIKRVIAVPGDTVQVKKGIVYVNGSAYEEPVDVDLIEEPGLAEEEIVLGEGEFFVLGDNRNNSEDSRYANIGNVKKAYIIGKVWFKVMPWSEFGFLQE